MTIRIFNEEREYIGIMVNTFNDLSHISKSYKYWEYA